MGFGAKKTFCKDVLRMRLSHQLYVCFTHNFRFQVYHPESESYSGRFTKIPIEWNAERLNKFVASAFPALRGTPLHYCYSLVNCAIRPIQPSIESQADLFDVFKSTGRRKHENHPTSFIVPDRQMSECFDTIT